MQLARLPVLLAVLYQRSHARLRGELRLQPLAPAHLQLKLARPLATQRQRQKRWCRMWPELLGARRPRRPLRLA